MQADPNQETQHSLGQDLCKTTATESRLCQGIHSGSFHNYSHSRSAMLMDQQYKFMPNINYLVSIQVCFLRDEGQGYLSLEYRSNCFGNMEGHEQLQSVSTNGNRKTCGPQNYGV